MVARQAFEDQPPGPFRGYALSLLITFRDEQKRAVAMYDKEKYRERETRFRSVNMEDVARSAENELESCLLSASAEVADSPEQIEALENAYFWHQVAEVAEITGRYEDFPDIIPSEIAP